MYCFTIKHVFILFCTVIKYVYNMSLSGNIYYQGSGQAKTSKCETSSNAPLLLARRKLLTNKIESKLPLDLK